MFMNLLLLMILEAEQVDIQMDILMVRVRLSALTRATNVTALVVGAL